MQDIDGVFQACAEHLVAHLPSILIEKFPLRSSRDMGLLNSNKGLEGSLSVNAEDGEGGGSAG